MNYKAAAQALLDMGVKPIHREQDVTQIRIKSVEQVREERREAIRAQLRSQDRTSANLGRMTGMSALTVAQVCRHMKDVRAYDLHGERMYGMKVNA